MDGVDGGLVAQFGGTEQHDFRFLPSDGEGIFRQVALLLEIITRSHDKEAFGVLVHVRALSIDKETIGIIHNRSRHISGR